MIAGKGVVVPAGGGQHLKESSGQVMSMKLFGRETGQSVTLFEQTVPAGSKNSWLHLHRDSDEIAWVLEGEFTFTIGEEVTTGGPGTCAFLPRGVRMPGKTAAASRPRLVPLHPGGAGRRRRDARRPREATWRGWRERLGRARRQSALGMLALLAKHRVAGSAGFGLYS